MPSAIDLVQDFDLQGQVELTQAPFTGAAVDDPHDELAHMRNTDIESIYLNIVGSQNLDTEVRQVVLDAEFEDPIDATPTFKITLHDPDWELLNSGALSKAIDLRLSKKRWYRLDAIEVDDDDITMTFIIRNAAYLMSHTRPYKVSRNKMTRALFILTMVHHVKKKKIKFFCPELRKKQPIEDPDRTRAQRDAKRDPGIPADGKGITVKGNPANSEQIKVIEGLLSVGEKKNASERALIGGVMVVTVETGAGANTKNSKYVGPLQQDPRFWPATGDILQDSPPFWDAMIKAVKADPDGDLGELCKRVQGAGDAAYAFKCNQVRAEAEQTVASFIGGGGTKSLEFAKRYEFECGILNEEDLTRENYMAGIYRLADEVAWRAFWVGDVLHYQSEERLFKSRARTRLRRHENGVETVNAGWDRQVKVNKITLGVRMERWVCPTGTVVVFDEGGPLQGRWLVTNIRKPVFDELGTIVLSKPVPEKDEPAHGIGQRDIGGNTSLEAGTVEGSPKDVIDNVVLPMARAAGLPNCTPAEIEAKNAAHNEYVAGTNRVSWHKGPPGKQWAADMSDNWGSSNGSPKMTELAKALAAEFNMTYPTDFAGKSADGKYNFQLIYLSSGHFNHVHFGVQSNMSAAQQKHGGPAVG